ncbi:hypothetical protein R6242_19330 [Iodobacter sp. CM08]|uniref:hypothetical protein n=1 Tax=Iodobacter sp. CM08 TaxID=3085902 RepID=UPI002980ADF5|nr:hypothetical protein [Iodobacter sp. CM08]MDW5418724.1 hypothetical protein [Iodobacter sp. CM08]
MQTVKTQFSSVKHYEHTKAVLDGMEGRRIRAHSSTNPVDIVQAKETLRFLSAAVGVVIMAHETGLSSREIVNEMIETGTSRAREIVDIGINGVLNMGVAAPGGHGFVVSYLDGKGKNVVLTEHEYRDFVVGPNVAELAKESSIQAENTSSLDSVCTYVEHYFAGLNNAVLSGEVKESTCVSTYSGIKSMCMKLFDRSEGSKLDEWIGVMEQTIQAEQSRQIFDDMAKLFAPQQDPSSIHPALDI